MKSVSKPKRDPDEWGERAAILEYDGGLPRAEAERRATEELGWCPKSSG